MSAHCTPPNISVGPIRVAKHASHALKAINFLAIKILVRTTKTPDYSLVPPSQVSRILARFDKFGRASDVARRVMLGALDFPVPDCPDRAKTDRFSLRLEQPLDRSGHPRQPAFARVAPLPRPSYALNFPTHTHTPRKNFPDFGNFIALTEAMKNAPTHNDTWQTLAAATARALSPKGKEQGITDQTESDQPADGEEKAEQHGGDVAQGLREPATPRMQRR